MALSPTITPNFKNKPCLEALCRSLARSDHLEPDHRGLFEAFAKSGEFRGLVCELVTALADGSDQIQATGGGSIIFFRNAHFYLLLQMNAKERDHVDGFKSNLLVTPEEKGMIALIQPGAEATITSYELPSDLDTSIFDDKVCLSPPRRTVLSEGGVFSYSPRCVFEMDFEGDHCFAVKLAEANVADFQWAFDNVTRNALFYTTCSTSSTRLETLIELLIRMAGSNRIEPLEAIEMFEALSRHDLHFIRWKAVQGLGEFDGTRALRRMREMQTDPHPHISELATEIARQYAEVVVD